MLKRVSRRRSEVGRMASELGPLTERPRQRPPTILMASSPHSPAAARAAFGAALEGSTFRGSPGAALEPAASRPAARRAAFAPRRSAAGTLVLAPGAEGAIPLRLPGAVVASFA